MKKQILEIGISSLGDSLSFVDYTDGDVVIIDNVRELSEVAPIKADMNALILCIKGCMQLDFNGRQLLLHSGEVLLAPPKVMLSNYMFSPDFECKILCLSKQVIQSLLRDEVNVWNQAVYVRNCHVVPLTDELTTQFSYYHSLLVSKLRDKEQPYHWQIMQSVVCALLFELCTLLRSTLAESAATERQSQGKVLFNRFLDLLQNARVKRRPVGHYAYELAVTPKYLTMMCEKYSGRAASEWIDQYVMEDVRYYLHETNHSVKEISSLLGFANMSHFGSYVRRHTGLSPKAFRGRKQ